MCGSALLHDEKYAARGMTLATGYSLQEMLFEM